MNTIFLYCAVVLIWGTTWIMIKLQLGVVAPEVSVAYRFALAAILMFAWVLYCRLPLRYSLKDHLFIVLQGTFLFCVNFSLFYNASAYLTTGLVAVIFSTAPAMVMCVNSLVQRQLPSARTATGVLIGIGGICIIFWPEIRQYNDEATRNPGLFLGLCGTLSFALGSIVSARNQRAGISVRGSTAWAMSYGAILLCLYAVAIGTPFEFDTSVSYLGSLVYLSVIGSVIAFACYFALIGRIGSDSAAYATILFPVVALSISTVFEDYQWTGLAIVGVAFTLIGNGLVLHRTTD